MPRGFELGIVHEEISWYRGGCRIRLIQRKREFSLYLFKASEISLLSREQRWEAICVVLLLLFFVWCFAFCYSHLPTRNPMAFLACLAAKFSPSNPPMRMVLGWLFISFLFFPFCLMMNAAMALFYREISGLLFGILLLWPFSVITLVAALLFYRSCFKCSSYSADTKLQLFEVYLSLTFWFLLFAFSVGLMVWLSVTQLNYGKVEFWEWEEEASLEDIQQSDPFQSVFFFKHLNSSIEMVPRVVGSDRSPSRVACAFPLLPKKHHTSSSSSSSSSSSTEYVHVAVVCLGDGGKSCHSHLEDEEEGCFAHVKALWEGRSTLDGMVAVKTNVFQNFFLNTISDAVEDIDNQAPNLQLADSTTSIELFSEEEFEEKREKALSDFLIGVITLSVWMFLLVPTVGLMFVAVTRPGYEGLQEEDNELAQQKEKKQKEEKKEEDEWKRPFVWQHNDDDNNTERQPLLSVNMDEEEDGKAHSFGR